MIFMILNIILCGVMIALSFSVDRNSKINTRANPLENIILFYSSLFALMAITLALCLWGPRQLAKFSGRITFMLAGWYVTACCNYVLTFPTFKNKVLFTVIQILLDALAFYMLFLAPNGFNAIAITYDGTFQIASGYMFKGDLGRMVKISWFTMYRMLFIFVIPAFTGLMVLIKMEHEKVKLERQRLFINLTGIIASCALFIFFDYALNYQSMILSLAIAGFIPQMLFFVRASQTTEVWDGRIVVRSVIKFFLSYFAPALLIGIIYAGLWPFFNKLPITFILTYVGFTIAVTIVLGIIQRKLKNKAFLRDKRYAESFEREISSIDYTQDPKEITNWVFEVFKKYVDTSSMKMLVDSGTGHLETVFASDGVELDIPLDDITFDTLLNIKHPIVFREWAYRSNSISPIKQNLLHLLDSANADAFILLNEGRQIIGLIFLGKKESGNIYSEYDYEVFNKLYSNFFVVGYYMKNIMNEDVVGTVNREIRMSGQIITSIQENMDVIKNPKVDVGYLMNPAHNIGGEFVDFIRLNDTRHIFVMGSLSGKGIAASMNMVILKSIIRTFLAETTDFKLLVQKVNLFIRESLPKGTFFSGTFGLIDFATDTLYYINCGTPAIFLYTRAYNNVIEIQGEGKILGFVRDISPLIKVKKVKLAPGDIVMSCTDGLIETRSLRGETFGKSRVQSCLVENSGYPATKMASFTYDSLVQFTSKELDDDITIIVLKYLGGK